MNPKGNEDSSDESSDEDSNDESSDEDSSDESSDEDSGDESTEQNADEILQALFRHGFVLKPRARRAYEQGGAVRTIARKTQHRSRHSRTQRR